MQLAMTLTMKTTLYTGVPFNADVFAWIKSWNEPDGGIASIRRDVERCKRGLTAAHLAASLVCPGTTSREIAESYAQAVAAAAVSS